MFSETPRMTHYGQRPSRAHSVLLGRTPPSSPSATLVRPRVFYHGRGLVEGLCLRPYNAPRVQDAPGLFEWPYSKDKTHVYRRS